MTSMQTLVTEEQLAAYQEDGVVLIRGLFDSYWLDVLAEGVEENLKNPTQRTTYYVDEPEHKFFYDACTLGEINGYDRLMLDSPMAEAAAKLMRSSSAILFYVSVFVRSQGIRKRTPWHQDQPFWSASGDQALSAWMSLDPVPKETALEFVRGSHRWETQYQRSRFFTIEYEDDDKSKLSALSDIEAECDRLDIVSWEMQPSDCVFFHGMTTHGGSGDLPPGLGRRAISAQWLGDDTRFRLLEGGDDPRISEDLTKYGVKPGDPIVCDMCPIAYPRQ